MEVKGKTAIGTLFVLYPKIKKNQGVATFYFAISKAILYIILASSPLLKPDIKMILHCSNFTLRPLKRSDAQSISENANNAAVSETLRDAFPHPYTCEDAIKFIDYVHEQEHENILAISVDGKAVGCIGYINQIDVERYSVELGYWLGKDHWGHGIVTEAVKALVPAIFTHHDVNRIYAFTFSSNPASARVLEHCGFMFEGRLKNAVYKNGQFMDKLVYAVLNPDFNPPRV